MNIELESSLQNQLNSLTSAGNFGSHQDLLKYALNLVELEQQFVSNNREQLEIEIERAYSEPSFEVDDTFWNKMIDRASETPDDRS